MRVSKQRQTLQEEIEQLTKENKRARRRWKYPLLFLLACVILGVILLNFEPWSIWPILCMTFLALELKVKRKCTEKPAAKVQNVPILLIVILAVFLSAVGLLCVLHRDTLYFLLGTPLGALWLRLVLMSFLISEGISMSVYLYLEREE